MFVFCRDPLTFVLERLLSCVKIALIVNRVFSKTCPEVFIQVLCSKVVQKMQNLLIPSICGLRHMIC